jgi:exonuclease III
MAEPGLKRSMMMVTRRGFLRIVATAFPLNELATYCAGSGAGLRAGGTQAERLCTIAYNVLQCTGWPVANAQKRLAWAKGQVPERFALELGLYAPDIISFAEAPEEAIVQEIAGRLGMKYCYFPSGDSWPGALMTRLELKTNQNCPVKSGSRPADLFTRHWGMGRLRNPTTGAEIVVHSIHLHPNNAEIRSREVSAILEAIEPNLRAGESVLLQGDFNSTPDGPEYKRWLEAGFVDTFTAAGAGGGETFMSHDPKRRIDYVFVAGPLAQSLKEGRRLFEGAFRTNRDDPGSFALSDHVPQMAVFGKP